MTSCDVVLPDDTHHTTDFERVPVANERVAFGDVVHGDAGWGELAGKRFHVGGVTWKTVAPGFDAKPTIYLVGGAG